MQNQEFTVEIDSFIIENESCGFIREIKSYPSSNKYAWNSDIMQLTTQNMVLQTEFGIDFYYGEIAYIGSGNIVSINTKPYEKAVNFAARELSNGQTKIGCSNCSFLDIPCYEQVRYKNVYC